jgi:REP element-mobilizing transposase RayT
MERYRFHPDGTIFYLTFTIVDWLPVFVSEEACKFMVDNLDYCHRHKGLRTKACVIMPTHMHSVCFHENLSARELERVYRASIGGLLSRACSSFVHGRVPKSSGQDRERRSWQASRHPVRIETESYWQAKLDYLHANVCRKGLVHQPKYWRFSSAAYWLTGGTIASEVLLTAIYG